MVFDFFLLRDSENDLLLAFARCSWADKLSSGYQSVLDNLPFKMSNNVSILREKK